MDYIGDLLKRDMAPFVGGMIFDPVLVTGVTHIMADGFSNPRGGACKLGYSIAGSVLGGMLGVPRIATPFDLIR